MDPSYHENSSLRCDEVGVAHNHVDVDSEEVLVRKVNHVTSLVFIRHVPPVVLSYQVEWNGKHDQQDGVVLSQVDAVANYNKNKSLEYKNEIVHHLTLVIQP